MKQEKYVAYVGTYTHENSVGIHIYDVDVEAGRTGRPRLWWNGFIHMALCRKMLLHMLQMKCIEICI